MNSTESENENENEQQNETQNEQQNEQQHEQQNETKIDRRTIKTAPWRYITNEDGTITYNHKPVDPKYFQKYYDAKRKFIDSQKYECECCNRTIAFGHKARHQKTKYCIKAKNDRMTQLLG